MCEWGDGLLSLTYLGVATVCQTVYDSAPCWRRWQSPGAFGAESHPKLSRTLMNSTSPCVPPQPFNSAQFAVTQTVGLTLASMSDSLTCSLLFLMSGQDSSQLVTMKLNFHNFPSYMRVVDFNVGIFGNMWKWSVTFLASPTYSFAVVPRPATSPPPSSLVCVDGVTAPIRNLSYYCVYEKDKLMEEKEMFCSCSFF